MKEIIRYFDCFAGIGGFHCGAQEIKSDRYEFSHVAFCEIEKNAQKVYEATCVNGWKAESIGKEKRLSDGCFGKEPAGKHRQEVTRIKAAKRL